VKKDAHYYAILGFCRACGFKKEAAQVIAYASQFVDDAKINLIYVDDAKLQRTGADEENPKDRMSGERNLESSTDKSAFHVPDDHLAMLKGSAAEYIRELEYEEIQGQPAFFNIATCHSYYRVKTFNYEAMINNTSAFHFVPGCKGENFTKKLRCKEESPVILSIFHDALQEDDLVKLGIVLHVYADTFAHQGFSGMLSKVNDIKNCQAQSKVHLSLLDRILNFFMDLNQENFDKHFDSFMPAYGHGQVIDYPDLPYLEWSYEYDCSDEFNGSYKRVEMNNKDRYSRAFTKIKGILQGYLAAFSQYRDESVTVWDCEPLFAALLYPGSDKARIRNWQSILVAQGLFNPDDHEFLRYDENQWLREAFANFDPNRFANRQVEGAILADHFQVSHWYRFYQAVKWYKQKFFLYCARYQLQIPN
jgi:hypothetical protein